MNSNRHLIISGIFFTVVLFLWPVLMVFFQPAGTEMEQLNRIASNTAIYKMQFIVAFFIGPGIVYMMLAELNKFKGYDRLTAGIGLLFLTVYLVLISISYASQFILVPGLLNAGSFEKFSTWYFNSPGSVAYFMNQTGYFFWAVSAIILFGGLIKRKGMIRYISIIYLFSAILSIIAYAGLIIENMKLNSLTLLSGLVLAPVGILTVVWGMKGRKEPSEE